MKLVVLVEGAIAVGDIQRAKKYVRILGRARGVRWQLVPYCRQRGVSVDEYLADVWARVREAGEERSRIVRKGGVFRWH